MMCPIFCGFVCVRRASPGPRLLDNVPHFSTIQRDSSRNDPLTRSKEPTTWGESRSGATSDLTSPGSTPITFGEDLTSFTSDLTSLGSTPITFGEDLTSFTSAPSGSTSDLTSPALAHGRREPEL